MDLTPLDAWIAHRIGQPGKRVCRETIERFQLKALGDVIEYARQRSPFYRQHLDGVPSTFTDMSAWSSVPFIDDDNLRQDGQGMVCTSMGDISRIVTLFTSGSTGEPKRIFFTDRDLEIMLDFFYSGMFPILGSRKSLVTLMPGSRPATVGDLLDKALTPEGVNCVDYGFLNDPQEAWDCILEQKASCVIGLPSQVLALARWVAIHNKLEESPITRVLVSGEPAPQWLSQAIGDIFNCDVFVHYGMTETGFGGAVECDAHDGLHIREADLYIEIIEPTSGNTVPLGEAGEIVVSTLNRQGMPLIRYRTGDFARLLPGKCACGSLVQRLERVRSRSKKRTLADAKIDLSDLDSAVLTHSDIITFVPTLTYGQNSALLRLDVASSRTDDMFRHEIVLRLKSILDLAQLMDTGNIKIEIQFIASAQCFKAMPAKRRLFVAYDHKEDDHVSDQIHSSVT